MKLCWPLCFQQTQQDASGWKGCTNTRTWKCLWTEVLFLSPLPRVSRNVVFVLGQVAACFVKSQTHRLSRTHCTTLRCFMCSCLWPRNIHGYILYHIHCVGGVAKLLSLNTPAKWVRKMNIPTEDFNKTSLSLLWYSDLTDGKIATVYQNGWVG